MGKEIESQRISSDFESNTSEQETLLYEQNTNFRRPISWLALLQRSPVLLTMCLTNLVLSMVLISFIMRNFKKECEDISLKGVYSPANEIVRYKNVNFQKGFITDMSPYQGWPSDEKDYLWGELYRHGMPVRVPKEDAHKLPNETAHYTIEGMEDDYMVGIDVFHQLHCLNVLRRSFYPQRYPGMGMWHPNGTLHMLGWVHIDHCIETIRQSLQCTSDVAPLTFRWMPERKYMLLQMSSYHRCRDFDALQSWAKKRNHGKYSERKHVEDGKLVSYEGYEGKGGNSAFGDVSEDELRRVRWDLPDAVREGMKWDGT